MSADGELEVRAWASERFRRWEQWLERVGSVGIGLLLLAAVAGLFGQGPLSSVRASSPDGSLHLEHQRFLRRDSPASLHLSLAGADPRGAEVELSAGFLDGARVEAVTPQPVEEVPGPDGVRYHFAPGGGPLRVRIDYQADEVGWRRGWIGVPGGSRLPLNQFTYP